MLFRSGLQSQMLRTTIRGFGWPALRHEVIASAQATQTLVSWCEAFEIEALILGDQTGSKQWRSQIQAVLPALRIESIDERFSSQEARDRFWDLYPAQGFDRLLPRGMRVPPRAIDDLVAIILVERFLGLNRV